MNERSFSSQLRCKLLAVFVPLALLVGPLWAQTPQIASGDDFTAVVDASGNLYTYGSNGSGQLGIGSVSDTAGVVQLVGPAGVWASVAVSRQVESSATAAGTGLGHVLAIRKDGTLWAWGANDRGQLGDGTTIDRSSPVRISNLPVWVEVAAGANFSMARASNGQVYVWGDNRYGQLARTIDVRDELGIGHPGTITAPINLVKIPTPLNGNSYLSIAAGLYSATAVASDGKLYAWGYSQTLQLGQTSGSIVGPSTVLLRIGTGTSWTRVVSSNTTCFGFQGGRLYVWGAASNTGVGNGQHYTPVQVGSATNWESISVGYDHTLALKNGGELWGWGDNGQGELGLPLQNADGYPIGANYYKSTPIRLQPSQTFTAIGAGLNFSSIYTSDAFLLTAGVNDKGQLGNGTVNDGVQAIFLNGSLGQSDLIAQSLVLATATLTPGTSVSANVFLENSGTGSITDDFQLGAVLTPFPLYDALGSRELTISSGEVVTADIPAGGTLGHNITVQIPSDIPVGSYYLVVRADVNEVLTEVSRANNDVVAEDNLGQDKLYDFKADLSITSANISVDPDPDSLGGVDFPLEIGDPMTVTYTITNVGNGSLTAGVDTFTQRVVLSETNNINALSYIQFDPDDLSELIENGGLSAGDSITRTLRFTIPNSLGVGSFYVGVSVDDASDTPDEDGAILESNEENNFAFTATAAVSVAGIELEEAVDSILYTTPIDFAFTTSSAPGGLRSWFGQTVETSDGIDAARSPGLAVGQTATFTQSGFTTEAVLVTFKWKAQTSSAANYLYFGLGGVEINSDDSRISGTTGWVETSYIVPPNSQMTWTYVQGASGADDVVYVDALTVVSLSAPDLLITSVTGQAGSYVLGSDDELQLSMVLINQGASTSVASGIPFNIGVYLSQDPDFNPGTDILIDSLPVAEVVEGGSPFVYIPVIELGTSIPSGNYYLIVVADDGDTVDEGSGAAENNNVFVSSAADVEILSLPDIRVGTMTPEPGYYLVGGDRDIKFGFSIKNDGLQGVVDAFTVKIVLSVDNVPDNSDYEVASFPFAAGLPVGATVAIKPDIYEIPNDVPLGQRLYFGVIVDADNVIAEQDETNNAASYPDNDFVFSEVSINEAFDIGGSASVDDADFYPFDSDLPWYGFKHDPLNSPAGDLVDSIRSLEITDGESSALEFSVNATTDTFVTFRWKVSSENDFTVGKFDSLNFYVDDLVNPVAQIAGEVDWRRVSYKVPAGTHILRWAYIKDETVSAGADAGWLDSFQFADADLIVEQIDFPAGNYTPGATINDFEFTVSNIGVADVPETPSYTISIIASVDTVFGNDGDNVLATITNSQGLLSGVSRDYTVDLLLPPSLPEGNYYIGVKVDSLEIIPESSDSNNTSFTASQILDIVPAILLSAAIDNPIITSGLDSTAAEFAIGGQQGWFAVANALLPDGRFNTVDGVDAVQSGPIQVGEESYFQTIVSGPQELKFRWKVNSSPNSNVLRFTMNDQVIEQISGDVDWNYSYGSFTLTYNGQTTAAIGAGSSAMQVQDALNALSTITAHGGVTVMASGGTVPLQYTITFDDPNNRNPISVTFLNPQKVNLGGSSFSTDVNGNPTTAEVQTLTIVPNVSFRLRYEGQNTSYLPYTATAAEVEAALDLIIPSGVSVTGADLDFQVTFDVDGEQSAIVIDDFRLNQPGTIEDEITTLGEVGVNQVQQLRMGPEITVFIPAGTQELRWTYSKTTTGAGTLDAAWVDQITFTEITQSELVLTALNYTPGEYVLDVVGIAGAPSQLLGTEYLDITVEAENQGGTLGATSFTSADLEVRLSLDSIYGNGDDIVIGTVSQVEGDFEAGNLMRFLGPIQLGDSIPENSYYLMARIDSNDSVDEYDEANNIVISENRDVTITRLPALRIFNPNLSVIREAFDIEGDINYIDPRSGGDVAFDLDEGLFYYSESPMRLRFAVQNIGLDRVEGSTIWTTQVNLIGALRTDIATALDLTEMTDAFEILIELGDYTIQELLEGRSAAKPEGDILNLDIDLALPNKGRLDDAIDPEFTIEDYLWAIEVTLDSTDMIRESQIVTEDPLRATPSGLPWRIISPLEVFTSDYFVTNTDQDEGLFGISRQPSLMTAVDWELLYPGFPTATPEYLLAYAFNRNPADGDTAANQFPGTYGLTTIGGETYLNIAFDIVTRATDLEYVVQADSDAGFGTPEELLVVRAPFNALTGVASLTGEDGLIDGYIVNPLALPQDQVRVDNVTNVLDQGYSARVVVKDTVDTATEPMRFIRVVVNTEEVVPVP